MSDPALSRQPDSGALPVALGGTFVLIFLLYSLNYLYFFVDDEGIPFVFAQNLLAGRGFVYNSFEGRVEGYSDFLHVLLSTVSLGLVTAAGLPKMSVFFVGKAVSLLAGSATVAVVFTAMRRLGMVRPVGAIAGLAFLALAGPLAVWSCSSLEIAPVALLTTSLATALLRSTPRADRVALVAAILLILLRIDGFAHAGSVLGAFWLFSERARRRRLERTVLLPLIAVFLAYHTWRVWYFGDWLSAPLYSKILHRHEGRPGFVLYEPELSYGRRFLETYGLPAGVAGLLLLGVASWRSRVGRPLCLAAAAIALYASRVSDWMPGFRFFVAALPLFSLAIAVSVSSIRRPLLARATTVVLCLWFGLTGYRTAIAYHTATYGGSWWATRSFAVDRYFGPDYDLYRQTRGLIPRYTRTAFNQAGFLPFMLDLDNLDDIGLCSRFVAKLPTTDVIFTETGRYSPLTNLPSLRTANAYVLYREPAYVIARAANLRSANRGRIPDQVLAGHYELNLVDGPGENAVYSRTSASVERFQTNPNTLLENLAHTSRLRRALWAGSIVPPERYLVDLGFLAGDRTNLAVPARAQALLHFADEDLPVHELHLNDVSVNTPVVVVLSLEGLQGEGRHRTEFRVEANSNRDLHLYFPEPIPASRLTVDLVNLAAQPANVRLFDLRVQGQTRALAAYVRALPFPPR